MKKKIVAWFLLFAMMIALVPAGSVQAATYKKNSSGTKVKYLQQNLSFLGFSTKGADGKFGGNTQKAVINAQKALQLPQTGEVNEELYTLISETVSGIQTHLKNKGYYSGKIDGITGTGTQTAFEKIQRDYGYARTGIADRYVLTEMVNDVEKSEETKSLREWVARLNGTYDDTLESDYYAKYGEEYLELFYKYPEVLDFYDVYIDYETKHANIVYKEAYKEQDEAIVWEGVANGVPVLINHLTGLFGVSEDEYDKLVYNTIMSLVMKMYYKDNDMYQAVKEINNAVSTFEGMYSFADESSKSILIQELMKLHPELTKETIKEIVDTIGEEWGGVARFLDGSVTIVKYTVAATELYSISDEFIKQLKQSVKQPSLLYFSLCYLEEIKEQSVEEFLIRHLASELSVELIEGLLNGATGGTYEAIVGTLRLLSDFFVQATVDEQQNTYMMRFYCENLKDTLIEMREDLVENADLYIESEMNQKIKNYETTYNFYLCALEAFYESAMEMASIMPWDQTKEVIQKDLDYLKDYNYDLYVQMCLVEAEKIKETRKSVTQKMDEMLSLLGVKEGKNVYCTVNQKACTTKRESPHGCKNCNMRDIANSNWFINLFGKVNVDNFPEHDVNASRRDHTGQSCFGFSCFAQWYIYADSLTDKVESERVATVKFNKANMQKYVQPGDVVRVNGHSILVYSVEENGLMVIDSNWNLSGQLNCVVQKHLIPYTNEYCAGHTAYINRVKTSENEVINTNEKTQYGYYHYTNGEGKYSVCAHYGKETSKWNKVYYEEVWLDEPLTLTSSSASGYRHVEVNGCKDIGCVDGFWSAGGKYEDASGVVWYRQKTRVVPKDTEEEKSSKFIWEKEQLPQITQAPIQNSSEQEVSTSGWVKASECPADAQIIETKWTYTYTEQKESSSTSMEGWINSGERKEVVASGSFEYASFPETFDTKNAIYKEIYSSKDAVPVAAGAQREILSDNMTGYVYWHYTYPVADKSVGNRIVGYYYNQHLKKEVGNWCYTTSFAAIKTAKNYTTTATGKSGGGKIYKITDKEFLKYDVAKGSYWWYRFAYNTCTYQDVKTVYQYYKTSEKESFSEVKEGNGISNVVKWVKYKQ